MKSLEQALNDYLSIRRSLGYQLRKHVGLLLNLWRFSKPRDPLTSPGNWRFAGPHSPRRLNFLLGLGV